MKAEEFVSLLRLSAPDEERLVAAGLSSEEIRELMKSYRCVRRQVSGVNVVSDELERLIVEFDCSSAEVGVMTFMAAPRPMYGGVVVGRLEAEPIVLMSDGRVVMFEHETVGGDGVVCASSGAALLDGLAHLLRAGTGRSARSPKLCHECAALAGVDSSSDFWRTLAE